jgi:hypothetical protein
MPGPINARSSVLFETESANGPAVMSMHRVRARRREDRELLEPESEYVRAMRMINLLVSGQHPALLELQ